MGRGLFQVYGFSLGSWSPSALTFSIYQLTWEYEQLAKTSFFFRSAYSFICFQLYNVWLTSKHCKYLKCTMWWFDIRKVHLHRGSLNSIKNFLRKFSPSFLPPSLLPSLAPSFISPFLSSSIPPTPPPFLLSFLPSSLRRSMDRIWYLGLKEIPV